MKRSFLCIALILSLLLSLPCALAADQPPKADEALVKQLLPDDTMVSGIVNDGVMRLIMEKQNGTRVFVGGVQDENGAWQLTESTPLPEGAILGVENFVTSLGIKGESYYHAVTLSPFHDGTWGVTLLYPEGDAPMIFMGQNWISTDSVRTSALFGDHAWSDITVIDWNTLPVNADEAVPFSAGDWALVHNPDPADRLNLRTEPNTSCRTLGKYYNGTPVKLLTGRSNGFVQVDILGVTGWMMEDFISYETSTQVIPMVGLQLFGKEDVISVYEKADAASPFVQMNCDFVIIGVVGSNWYHVWYPTLNFGGYVQADALWEGNG